TGRQQQFNFFLLLVLFSSCARVAFAQDEQTRWAKWETDADTLMGHQDFNGAIKLYSKIIDESKLKDKSNYKALYKRAVGYYSIENFDQALKDVSLYVNQFAESPKAHLLLALIYRHKNDEVNQLIEVQKCIELGNRNPQLLFWRGTLLAAKGEYELAKKDLLLFKTINDDAEVEAVLGSVYHALGNIDSAFVCLNNAIILDVNYTPSYLYAGSFCMEQKEYDLAIKYLNLALRIEPENASALFYKGVALVENDKIDQGCSCLRKALEAGEDGATDYLKEFCYGVYK
ncbi:MAG TPA: hypothetical protein DGG95_08160, partial [Cytophagales bacterium]|nr:hypothetical protein [Cytophagales bacterium]